jgi:hypothetical protein
MFPIRSAVPTRHPPLVTRAPIAANCAPRQKEALKRATGA